MELVYLEGWQSGLMHTLGTRAGVIPRRFESCPLRYGSMLKYHIDVIIISNHFYYEYISE